MNDDLAVDNLEAGSVDSLVSRVADEFLERLNRGERPDVDEYARRYPKIAAILRQVLPTVEVMGGLTPAAAELGDKSACESAPVRCLGDYQIIREIGRGGMGVVYEAEQVSIHRRVALKVLPFAAVLDPKQLQRFRNESQAAGQLHHQNIVPVYSVGCERGVHYYAMQYIEGQTLADVVAELRHLAGLVGKHDEIRPAPAKPRMTGPAIAQQLIGSATLSEIRPSRAAEQAFATPCEMQQPAISTHSSGVLAGISTEGSTKSPAFFRAVSNLGVQAAQALEHAHGLGVVHRDIKPANVLVDARGNLWITDFGLAQVQSDAGLTMTGDLLGTIRYMSPEQALAKRVMVDHRTDIYSLGVTLYELLTLEPAFNGRDRQEVLRQIAFEEPKPPRRLNKAIPTELETIVLKAVAKNPESRYATAQELADDLARFLEDKPIKAKRPSVMERAAKWSRRHKTLVNMAAVLVVGVAVVASAGYFKTKAALEREAVARQEEAVARQDADRARDEAEKAEARAMKSAAIAEAINDFLLHDVLEQANPENNPGGDQLTVRQLLDRAAEKLETSSTLAREPEVEAAIRHTIGDAYTELAVPSEAERHLRKALELRQRVLGPDQLDTLITMNRLAWALCDIPEKSAEAETLAKQTADLCQRALGADHAETIYAVDTLTSVYLAGGRLKQAESIERDNLNAARQALGTEHERTRTVSNNLGWILQKTGKLAEAEELYRENLQIIQRIRTPDHSRMLLAMNNLAFLLLARAMPDEAVPLFERVVDSCRNLYGPEHPKTLKSMGNLALALREQDRLDEAETLIRQTWDVCSHALTPEHPTTQTTLNKLALVLESQGNTAEAEPQAQQLLDIRSQTLGPEHPETLVAANTLAIVWERAGKLADAERLHSTNLYSRRHKLGPGHPDTLQSMGNLARVLVAEGRAPSAVPLLREAIAAQRTEQPAVPRYLAEHLSELGQALTALSKPDEAKPLLEESLKMHRALWPNENWRTAKTASRLGGCLTALGKYEDAEPLLLASYEALKSIPFVPPECTRQALDRIIKLYESWGKPDKAAEWRNKNAS